MSADPEPGDHLSHLLSALEDGTLDAAGEARLIELLRDDPAARAQYYNHVLLSALLRREGRRVAAQNQSHSQRLRSSDPRQPGSDDAPRPMVVALTGRSRPWLLALATSVLLGLLLSVSEATGVTRLVPTIIRIVTGEGSLVIEVDDPGVS